MKKNIFNTVSILLVFSFLFGFAACNKGDDTETTSRVYAKVTKENGSEEEVELVTDNKGELETFTNAAGETQVAYVDNDTKETVFVNKDALTTVVVTETTTQKKNNKKTTTKATETDAGSGSDEGLIDNVPTTMLNDNTMPSDNAPTVSVPVDSSGNPINPGVEKSYQDIIDSGKYTMYCVMKITDSGTTTSFPMVMAVDGNKLYIEATPPEIDEISMTIKFVSDGSKCYIVIPKMLSYCEVPSSTLEEMLPTQAELDEATGTYVSTTEVTFEGKTYTCETYDTDDGVVKYYYLGDALKRIETISDTGTITIMDITYLSSNVSANLFKVPSNYIELDSSMFEGSY